MRLSPLPLVAALLLSLPSHAAADPEPCSSCSAIIPPDAGEPHADPATACVDPAPSASLWAHLSACACAGPCQRFCEYDGACGGGTLDPGTGGAWCVSCLMDTEWGCGLRLQACVNDGDE